MNNLQIPDNIIVSKAPLDVLVQYAEHGVMDREIAEHITKQPLDVRLSFVEQSEQLLDVLSDDEKNRLEWLVKSLSKETVNRVVVIETVSSVPVVVPKYGLGERAFTSGRHSSSDTFGSSKKDR